MIVSIGYVYSWNARQGIIANLIGELCLGINLIIWIIIAPTMGYSNDKYVGLGVGFYLGIIGLIIFSLALLFLIENKRSLQENQVGEKKKIKKDKQICPSCGSEITDSSSTFCNKCGSPLE